uniref:Splicing factor 3B subunit 2 n=1 Tax=Cacopsylla melanoneura TaxID=428564 RepID=A0A8D9AEZ4_9HEMI
MSFDSSVPPPLIEGSKKELPSLLSLNVEPPAELILGRNEEFGEEKERKEVKLPVALEQALAFKSERAKQIGVNPEDIASVDPIEETNIGQQLGNIYDDDEEEEEDEDGEDKPIETSKKKDRGGKNKRKKKKKKRRKHNQQAEHQSQSDKENQSGKDEPEVEIEYIQETLSALQLPPMYRQFAKIFEAFKMPEPEKSLEEIAQEKMEQEEKEREEKKKEEDLKKVPKAAVDDDEDAEQMTSKSDGDPKDKMSKRKLKKLTRLSVAELKQLVHRPDVVEMHDVTARDPKLLVQLKAYRNTVPVPRHWCFKRKYLQGKRGIEKPPFNLPEFIKKTGIMEMRASLQDKEEQKTLKSKMRERVRPKLGKIDIDYQKLHDAFFKWQTKPKLSIHGDLYYEGKEFETKLKEKKPGDLSAELRTALGMPVGPTAHKIPPPWLIAMQRYGPPPSYPNLKIPGLNAPIPQGCSFGYHAGGWGKPPVDETGKPLYGDVFGNNAETKTAEVNEEEIEKTAWGELESESEEEESDDEDEDEEEEEEGEGDQSGIMTPAEGLMTPSGITSIPAGMETPDSIELRKKKIESDMETNEAPQLFQVLSEKRPDKLGPAMMASTHMYEIPGAAGAPSNKRPLPSSVELALDPSELDLVDTEAMTARYEQQMREQSGGLQKEDLSDMLAEHVARQKIRLFCQHVQCSRAL